MSASKKGGAVVNKPPSLRSEIISNFIQKSYEEFRTALDLSKKLIGLEVPKQITILQSCLTHLNLSENELTSLPDAISQLVNLTSFDLSSNSFSIVPTQVYKLTQLQELNLSNNEIKVLTGEITALLELETLILSKNEISEVTPRLVELKSLRDLDLSYNDIVFLPSEYGNFIKLKTLDVRGNPLQFPPKSVAEKGIESILSFLGDKTFATISRNENRYSTIKQALNSGYGNKRRTTVFNLNTFSYNSSDSKPDKVPSAIPENEEMMFFAPTIQPNNARRPTDPSVHKNQTIKRHTMGINEPLLQDNLANVTAQLNHLRDSRKIVTEVRNEAMSSTAEGDSKQSKKELELLDKQRSFEESLSSYNNQIIDAMGRSDIESLMNLAHQRNNIRIAFTKELGACYNEMIQKAHSSPEDILNKLDSVSRADQLALSKVSDIINRSMKKTNDAAKLFIQAIDEEVHILEENKEWIKKTRENILSTDRIGMLSKKIAYFDALRVAELTKVPTPTQVAAMIKLFIDLVAETDENAKMALFSRMIDSRVSSVSAVVCYEINLAHQLELLAGTVYPEMKTLYPDLVTNVAKNADSPFVNYRLDDYDELIPMDAENKTLIGVNMYGVKCLVKKYPISSPNQIEKMKNGIQFLYKHHNSYITPVHAAWFDGNYLYVEEHMISGKTLRDWLEKNPSATVQKIKGILLNVLQALAYMHRFNFSWGSFSTDSIVIVQDEKDSDYIYPVLCNFDYTFSEQLSELDPPESQDVGAKVNTCSSDMFYFGQLMCELLSTDHVQAQYIRGSHGKRNFAIPPLSAKYASKHLHVLLQDLISRYPEKRSNACFFLQHPYFTVDSLPEDKKETRISQFYLEMFNTTESGKVLLMDFDPTLEGGKFLDGALNTLLHTPDEDLNSRSLYMVSIEPGLQVDALIPFFNALCSKEKSGMMVSVGEELPYSKFILPNPEYNDFAKLEALGKCLRRWSLDGFYISSVFPPVFFKLLLNKNVTATDYEICYPFDSTRRFVASNTFIQDIEILTKSKIIDCRKQQMEAIAKGFFAGPLQKQLKELSAFDLVMLLNGRYNDQLSSLLLKQLTSVEGFELDTNTLDFFWMWIDSLSDTELRKFLFYVTGRYSLPEVQILDCGHANYLLEHNELPVIHLHLSYLNEEVTRPFVHHIEIPPCQDYFQLQQKVVKAMNTFMSEEDLDN